MENIIDFYTGKTYKEVTAQDTAKNDALVDKYGVYLGNLIPQDTKRIRDLISQLHFLNNQIEQLNNEWDTINDEKMQLQEKFLRYLSPSKPLIIDNEKDSLIISQEGHVWVIYNSSDINEVKY